MTKIQMTPAAAEIVKQQLAGFREKFGRDPGPGDPVFFDPDQDVPTPMDLPTFTTDTLAALEAANVPPELIYAYKKTGRLLLGRLVDQYPPQPVREWDAAIAEYFALNPRTGRRSKKPK